MADNSDVEAHNLPQLVKRESHYMNKGGWKSIRSHQDALKRKELIQNELATKYSDYPLLQSMLRHEKERTRALEIDGQKQINYPKSNDGWLTTLFILEGRALDRIVVPWTIVVLNSIAATVIHEMVYTDIKARDQSTWESFFGLVLNSSLAFLLVFRLNRSAERFWQARRAWGIIIAMCRGMTGGILVHGAHDPKHRDEAIKWLAAFSVVCMHFMRSIRDVVPETVLGILNIDEVEEVSMAQHSALYAAEKVRRELIQIFHIDASMPIGIAHARTQHLSTLEKQLNEIITEMGGMERIRATPLPLVYVSHLRTFLLLFLLATPYVWGPSWGYTTIPISFLSSFALLGLEGAAQEVENPFLKGRTNHLNMDAYCLLLIGNMLQQIKQSADYEISQNQINSYYNNNKQEKQESSLASHASATSRE